MTEITLVIWLIAACAIVTVSKTYRVIICFGAFSLLSSVIYLFLGAPNVAMAEAGVSAFATIFMIVCIEKFYNSEKSLSSEVKKVQKSTVIKIIAAFVFCAGLCILFLWHVPIGESAILELRNQFLRDFMQSVGGENAVTAVYLGYRVYDTLFETLLLVIAVVAVSHMSWFAESHVADGEHSEMETSRMTKFTMRIICPIILMFGVYLTINGHISAGGGFLGGLAVTTFFMCRYLVFGIYDLPVDKIIKMEEVVFVNIVILPIFAIFVGVIYLEPAITPFLQTLYLTAMSALVGMKVACGFFVLFYRYVAIERME